MKVVGFTFIRNAIKYDYPIVEAILSILPLCEEVIVAVGKSEDGTKELLEKLNHPKIKLIDTIWDDNLRKGGQVLAVETNKSLAEIPKDTDWAFYIQGDEVFQTDDINVVKENMIKYKDDKNVDGLLFDYLHFYGSYDFVGNSSRWYKNEIRIIKLNRDIYSYRDAQGFRKGNNIKLNVKKSGGRIHHYGWVRPPYAQQRKQEDFNKLWHSDEKVEKMVDKKEEYDYISAIDSLELFQGNHPELMKERIARQDWMFNYDTAKNYLKPKDKFKKLLKKITGKNIGEYQNYKLI